MSRVEGPQRGDGPDRPADPPGGPPLVFLDRDPGSGEPSSFREEERAVLDAVNRRVAAAPSLEAIIDFLFDATQSVFPCDRIGIALLEEGGDRLVAHYARASYEPLLLKKGYAEDLTEGSLARVIRTGAPRIINDLARYLREHPRSRSTRLLLREGVCSSLTCPLSVEGLNVGVLFRSSRRAHAYDFREVRLHLALAERLSQAVEKTRRIEELAAANRAYTEMLGFVSHELKSPLASLVMDAQLLTGGYLGELADAQAAKIRGMVTKAEYLLGLVRDYLDLARVEGGTLRLAPRAGVDLPVEVLDPALEIVRPQLEAASMRLEREVAREHLRVECDPDLLRIVVVNLVGNGVKYGRPGGLLRLRAGRTETGVLVAVFNEGPGFPEAQRARLFRRFSRLDTPELRSRKGTGVGLYTSWKIVRLHHGRLEASSEEGKWAEFRLEIPQPLPQGPADPA